MNLFKESRTSVTLFIAIGLVAVSHFPPLQKKQHLPERKLFWIEKRYGKPRYDILLMGDSRTYKGVSPEILQKYIPNMSFYNFGFSSGRINRQLLREAKKRLKRNGKRILVFGCTYLDLVNMKNEHFFYIKELNPVLFALRSILSQKTNLFVDQSIIPHTPFGYMEEKRSKDENAILNTLKSYRSNLQKAPFRTSDFQHFVQNLKWCKKNNIKVVAYRMVSYREMDELEDELSGVDWNKIKQAVLDEGFVWIERPPSPLLEQIEEHCWDASHLNAEGAELFSNWLGQELAKLDWFKEDQQTSETKK